MAVPDLAASAFSGLFYTNFLQGRSLGEALYEARSGLMRDSLNPVGALYSAYANPDLRLLKPTMPLCSPREWEGEPTT
jgi:hypothetical protein